MANDPIGTVYQDVRITRGMMGSMMAFNLRVDNDPDTDRTFRTYNEALLASIAYLSQARIES